MDSNDNHVFEVTNLKSIIVELQEKLEYDCRRLNREFSEKLDNVYECIEKLEIGREKKLNKGTFLQLLTGNISDGSSFGLKILKRNKTRTRICRSPQRFYLQHCSGHICNYIFHSQYNTGTFWS